MQSETTLGIWPRAVTEALVVLNGEGHRTAIAAEAIKLISRTSCSDDLQKCVDDTLGRYSNSSGRRRAGPLPPERDLFVPRGNGVWALRLPSISDRLLRLRDLKEAEKQAVELHQDDDLTNAQFEVLLAALDMEWRRELGQLQKILDGLHRQ